PAAPDGGLEGELGADAQAIDRTRNHAGPQVEPFIVHVLELDLEVGIQIPVQAHGNTVHDAAPDGTVTAVEVEVRVADSRLPGPDPPVEAAMFIADEPEGGVRTGDIGRTEPAEPFVVGAVLARQEVRQGDIPAVEDRVTDVLAA